MLGNIGFVPFERGKCWRGAELFGDKWRPTQLMSVSYKGERSGNTFIHDLTTQNHFSLTALTIILNNFLFIF